MTPTQQTILPQYRLEAIAPYVSIIDQHITNPPSGGVTVIKSFGNRTQVTYAARLRDALCSFTRYNLLNKPSAFIEACKELIVSSDEKGCVLLGTRASIRALRAMEAINQATQTHPTQHQLQQNEVEIISVAGVSLVCSLIQNCSLQPQPLFFTFLPLNESEINELREKFPNVSIIQDKEDKNKYHFI